MKIYSEGKMLQVPPRGPAGPDGNPIGTIISFMGISAPDDYLVCNGATHNISDYPSLAAFFKQQFGTINHFGGDGTTTFAVPDLRNLFLRGYHGLADEQLSGDIGEKQEATSVPMVYAGSDSMVMRSPKDSYSSPKNVDSSSKTSGGNRYAIGNQWQNDTENATYQYAVRPVNTAVLYCIKAVDSKLSVIDTKDIYSLEEQVIGTWIDGKPIYQRVLQLTAPSTGEHGSRAIYTMPDPIDTWVQLTALINENGQWAPFPYVYPWTDTTTGLISEVLFVFGRDNTHATEPNTVRLIITNRFVNLPILAILKYTKATDSEEAT